MNNNNIDKITTSLISYFRTFRQFVCACEVVLYNSHGYADVLIDTEDEIIEVEVFESKKKFKNENKDKYIKHWNYKEKNAEIMPNKYYICIPNNLLKEAEEWVNKNNKKYGILIFSDIEFNNHIINDPRNIGKSITIYKKSKSMNNKYPLELKEKIIKRLSKFQANILLDRVEKENE